MPANHLPAAPSCVLNEYGDVLFGKFAGAPDTIDWSALTAPYRRHSLWQRFHHKHWNYVALATAEIFCGIAIVDVGWANTAFAYVFERRDKKMIASYSQDGIPGLSAKLRAQPAKGAQSHFRFFGKQIGFQHLAGTSQFQLQLDCKSFSIEALFDGVQAAPSLLAVGEVAGGTVHATVKSAGMPVSGMVIVDGRRFTLDGGVASYDHSNGFLARETGWRWASAHSKEIGFNLQAGYFGNNENALWLDGKLIGLGAARFEFDPANHMGDWHISTEDSLLDLHFRPEGFRAENKNLLVAASRYLQPIGVFNGWVRSSIDAPKRELVDLVGVTEDHFSRW